MRVCVLCYHYSEGDAPLAADDLPYDPTVYLDGHDATMVYLTKRTAVPRLIALAREGYDVFLNLCDGAWDGDTPGIEVVQALDRLDGLDLIARRPIAVGEEVRVDYATFYGEELPAFACDCGATDCRGTVRGADHRAPFVERYDGHVSEYVRARRAARDGPLGTERSA